MNTALFLNAVAQVAPEAPKASDPTGMYNLFVIIVVTVVFISILVAYSRGHKNLNNVANVPAAPLAKPVAVAEASAPAQVGTDPVILAILAAAAYTTLGQNVRIVSVSPVSTEWGVQGRRDIFLSHKIR